jgi:hypothetical protein
MGVPPAGVSVRGCRSRPSVNGISTRAMPPNVMTVISARFLASSSVFISSQNSSKPRFSSLIGSPFIDAEVSSSKAHAIRGSGLASLTRGVKSSMSRCLSRQCSSGPADDPWSQQRGYLRRVRRRRTDGCRRYTLPLLSPVASSRPFGLNATSSRIGPVATVKPEPVTSPVRQFSSPAEHRALPARALSVAPGWPRQCPAWDSVGHRRRGPQHRAHRREELPP